jgi:hypothetical protein
MRRDARPHGACAEHGNFANIAQDVSSKLSANDGEAAIMWEREEAVK